MGIMYHGTPLGLLVLGFFRRLSGAFFYRFLSSGVAAAAVDDGWSSMFLAERILELGGVTM